MDQLAAFFRRLAFDNCPVCFPDLFGLEHLVQAGKSFAGTGKKHNAADGPVDAMHSTDEHFPRLAVFFFYIQLYKITQRSIACFIALHNVRWPLVNSNNMIVLKKYL